MLPAGYVENVTAAPGGVKKLLAAYTVFLIPLSLTLAKRKRA
ncbi:hypothetical protein [Paenibacillus dendrobii]|nr:hypothetical protein [Paenibacillus dendrobii]